MQAFDVRFSENIKVTEYTIKLYVIILLIGFLLIGCSKTDIGEFSSDITKEIPAGEAVDAIFYNGKCYYGIAMLFEISEKNKLKDFEHIGTISSIVDQLISPKNELESTLGKVGNDVYHYISGDGKDCFCIPDSKQKNYYHVIYNSQTERPNNYE